MGETIGLIIVLLVVFSPIIIPLIIGVADAHYENNNYSDDFLKLKNKLFKRKENMKSKIDLLISYYELLLSTEKSFQLIYDYTKTINSLKDIRDYHYNLNYQGQSMINEHYYAVIKVVDQMQESIAKMYLELDRVPLEFEFEDLLDMISDCGDDLKSLDSMERFLRYLLLISNDLKISKSGYKKFNAERLLLPTTPKKIHVVGLQALMHKTILEEEDPSINELVKDLLDIEENSEIRKLFRKLYKQKLHELKSRYDDHEQDEDGILGLILFLDPDSASTYDKNNKYYSKLGLDKDATEEEIQKAYKKLMVQKHPDRGGDVKEWEKINEAYSKIST